MLAFPRRTPWADREAGEIDLLFLLTTAGIGGTERVVLSLARHFGQSGYRVRTLVPDVPEARATSGWFAAEGVRAQVSAAVTHMHRPHTPLQMYALFRLLRGYAHCPVNLHYGMNRLPLQDLLAARLAGIRRLFVSVHHAGPITSARHRGLTRLASWLADRILVPSQATRESLVAAGVAGARIEVVPNGVPRPRRGPSRTELRTALGIGEAEFVLFTLARLVPEKGIDVLLGALERLDLSEPPTVLLIGGSGDQRGALEGRAQRFAPGRIRFLGQVADPSPVYGACDLFALPSYGESFGLVFAEAALHGVASVGTRVGGVPEVIDHGRTGLLVPPGDPVALASAIEELRQNESRRTLLGRQARRRAEALFTEPGMAARYARLLFGAPAPGMRISGPRRRIEGHVPLADRPRPAAEEPPFP